jgi:hypothetical protein
MKIKEHTSRHLTLKDSAGCFWLLGLFFVVIAGTFVLGLMGLFTNLHELKEWELISAWIVSLGGLSAGIWFIYSNPGTTVNFDKTTGTVTINRRGLLRNETEVHKLRDITDITIEESKDSEGDPVYRTELKFRTHKPVPLSMLWINNKPVQEENLKVIKELLRPVKE